MRFKSNNNMDKMPMRWDYYEHGKDYSFPVTKDGRVEQEPNMWIKRSPIKCSFPSAPVWYRREWHKFYLLGKWHR